MSRKAVPLADRFWSKVNVTSQCWLWQASITGGGYGQIGLGKRGSGRGDAHRVSWLLCNGPIPDDKQVLHHCDNKLCVNPDHLYLGTRIDNMRDALERGQKLIGSQCSFAKLNREQVLDIRKQRADGVTQQKLADLYGVSRGTIYRATSETAYRDI